MNDRDKFAAAALTGLLAGRTQTYMSADRESYAKSALALADAMLAARGTTDHDAAPALGPTVCDGCGNAIDPELCGCGQLIAEHRWTGGDGHSPIPVGCVCFRDTTDHDAAPAAVPAEPAAGEVHEEGAASGTGDTPMVQPAARQLFGRLHTDWDGTDYVVACKSREEAERFQAAGHKILHICDLPLQSEPSAPPDAGPTLTDAEREAVRECADIARSQLWNAREGGDEETIARWMQRLARIAGLLARAAKEGGR